MTLITDIRLRRVLDSRGNATVEADVLTESGGFGRGKAPSGASTGEYEAIERPANEAIANAREDALPRLIGEVHAGNQRDVDAALHAADGTDDFSGIGANSAVAISMAAAKAGADVLGAPLYQHLGGTFRGNEFPTPLGNIIGGGEHAADATNIQEFLAAPVGAPSVEDAVFANAAVHQEVHDILAERDLPAGKGDEGAWAPSVTDDEAFEIMAEAVDTVADEDGYVYDDGVKSTDEQIDYIAEKVEAYDLVYVEDPLDENDYEAFADLTEQVGDQTLICGDDLFVTNVERLQTGIQQDAGNSILIKPNQIGTLSDAVDAIELATENGFASVVSHRSGETEDTTIAHLAVATGAPFIKTGAVGGERTAKLNELIRIEDNAV